MKSLFFLSLLLLLSGAAWGAEGLVIRKSPHDAATTMNRLEEILLQKGMTIFARIDHAAGARKIGQELRPTEVIIFGNPKVGTALMRCSQTAGIDLPLKALVWQDESGQVWLGYNDPAWLAGRHQAPECAVVPKMTQALANFAAAATAP